MHATINGIRLAYSDRGRQNDTCFLLIHGFPLDSRLWDAQSEELSGEFRMLVPDLRGHGESDVVPGPYTMEVFADDLAGLLDHLSIPRAIIAGLSMGGYVAFEFWRRYPGKVQALVLMDTRAEPDSPEGKANRDASMKKLQAVGAEAFARGMLPTLLAQSNADNPEIAGKALAIMAIQPVAGLVADLQGMRDRVDSNPTLPTITVPALVVVGEEDQIASPAMARNMADAIPGSRLVTIPDAGHLAPLENPEAVNATLREFGRHVRSG